MHRVSSTIATWDGSVCAMQRAKHVVRDIESMVMSTDAVKARLLILWNPRKSFKKEKEKKISVKIISDSNLTCVGYCILTQVNYAILLTLPFTVFADLSFYTELEIFDRGR